MSATGLSPESLAALEALVQETLSKGQTLDWFIRQIRDRGGPLGWHEAFDYPKPQVRHNRAWTIYAACHRIPYGAMRHRQLVEGQFGYWTYCAGHEQDCPANHMAFDGLALPADHPFWEIWTPPNSLLCSCGIYGARDLSHALRRSKQKVRALPHWWHEPEHGPDPDYVGYSRPSFERIVERAFKGH